MMRRETAMEQDGSAQPWGASLNGRYMITGMLRDDGGSILYIGRATSGTGDPVMIKEVAADGFVSQENRANAQARFQREVTILQSLKHPALPGVLDAFTVLNRHYLVMSYCPGETLEVMLERRKAPFAEEDVVGWALEILSALGLMHRHHPPVIYRNLKPGNIVIDPTGMLRLLDFGLARFFTQGKRQDTAPLGALGYAPPEQTRGTTDARSDVYALGVTMHHLLTNQHPAQQPPGMLPPATSNPAVSAELAAVIARATDLDPGRRWASAAEMEMVLRRHVVALGAVPRPVEKGPPTAAEPVLTGARLVISAARPTASHDKLLDHLARLTWLARDDLEIALLDVPSVVPLVEPYRSSLRLLKGLGLEARPIWPLHGLHGLNREEAELLRKQGHVAVSNPAACEGGLCLCPYCHFGWILDDPSEAPPETCVSCGHSGWNMLMLMRCRRCGHEHKAAALGGPCPCCGLG